MRRIVGLILLAVCVGFVVMLFVPGAGEIAHALGKKCPRSLGGHGQQCHALDVITVVVFVSPMLLVIGLVLIRSPLAVRRVGNAQAGPNRGRALP